MAAAKTVARRIDLTAGLAWRCAPWRRPAPAKISGNAVLGVVWAAPLHAYGDSPTLGDRRRDLDAKKIGLTRRSCASGVWRWGLPATTAAAVASWQHSTCVLALLRVSRRRCERLAEKIFNVETASPNDIVINGSASTCLQPSAKAGAGGENESASVAHGYMQRKALLALLRLSCQR